MCLVDSTTTIDIDPEDMGDQYQCKHCSSTFRGIGKKIHCPTCESTEVEKI